MNAPRSQTGLSLVELMVTMVLGLVLLLGLTQIFLASQQGYRVQQSNSRLQDSSRYAMDYLTRTLRLADFWGGVEAADLSGNPGTIGRAGASVCVQAWVNDVRRGIRGYDGAATPPLDCIVAADYVPNSDMVVVRYADPDVFQTNAQMQADYNAAPSSKDVFVRALPGRGGRLFNLSDWNTVKTQVGTGALTEDDVSNLRYRASVIFLRPCSTKAGTNCTSSDDAGNPLPTLVSADLTPNGTSNPRLVQNAIAENVEQMQMDYGIDLNGDFAADTYRSAAGINDGLSGTGATPPLWDQVITARIGLVIRGDSKDGFSDTESYNLPGGYTYTPKVEDQRYQRRLIIKEVQIRNRVRQ